MKRQNANEFIDEPSFCYSKLFFIRRIATVTSFQKTLIR